MKPGAVVVHGRLLREDRSCRRPRTGSRGDRAGGENEGCSDGCDNPDQSLTKITKRLSVPALRSTRWPWSPRPSSCFSSGAQCLAQSARAGLSRWLRWPAAHSAAPDLRLLGRGWCSAEDEAWWACRWCARFVSGPWCLVVGGGAAGCAGRPHRGVSPGTHSPGPGFPPWQRASAVDFVEDLTGDGVDDAEPHGGSAGRPPAGGAGGVGEGVEVGGVDVLPLVETFFGGVAGVAAP